MNSYLKNLAKPSDIQEHLGLLHGLAVEGCIRHVVELGFRTGVSASAFLAAGVKLLSIDINKGCRVSARPLAKEYPKTFSFKVGDSRTYDPVETNLLFIDSDHTYRTTLEELERWETFCSTWIVLHDTVSFPDVLNAVHAFLGMDGGFWRMMLHLRNCNGLTILERMP